VYSVWEQKKLEARKILKNAAESPASSARFVGRILPGVLHGKDSFCGERLLYFHF
jgi:hypothetical protein